MTPPASETSLFAFDTPGEFDRLRGILEKTGYTDSGVLEALGVKDFPSIGRPCTLLEVVHPHPRPYFDFHIARVFIDDELNLPVRYEAYTWPKVPGAQPELQECYTYLNIKVNIGLKDDNFDPKRFRL